MTEPIQSDILNNVVVHGPAQAQPLAEALIRIRYYLNHLNPENERTLKLLFEAITSLDTAVGHFLALFKFSSEFLKENDYSSMKRLESDLQNVPKEIISYSNQITQTSPDRIYPSKIHQMKGLIVRLPNVLFSEPLISAYHKSIQKKETTKPSKLPYHNRKYKGEPVLYCDENIFFREFYFESKRRVGLFPTFQVFKAPTKTLNVPFFTPDEKKNMFLGVLEDLKKPENFDEPEPDYSDEEKKIFGLDEKPEPKEEHSLEFEETEEEDEE